MAWMISASLPCFALVIDAANTIRYVAMLTAFKVRYAMFSNLALEILGSFFFMALVAFVVVNTLSYKEKQQSNQKKKCAVETRH